MMSVSGWSGNGGLTKNPYDLTRNTCGSSAGSGAAISANLGIFAIGTETNGSIICPSSVNGIVGLKPTVGLVSRSGIIPISVSQDTAGPKMCESFNLQYGTNYIAVMPTNLYGPNDNFHLENSHVLPAMIRKIHLAKCLNEGDWDAVRKDINLRPVEGVNGNNTDEEILEKLAKFGITPEAVTLWGTGKPMREFLWSEEMADASVHVLLNVDFKQTYDASKKNADGITEIRNCHINVGTGKEVSIREVAEKIMKEIGFKGELRWDASKPDGTLRKLTDVSKLHSLGWHHKVEIDEGIHRLYEWYLKGICINHQTV
jgi:GDP-L-fucose synthase